MKAAMIAVTLMALVAAKGAESAPAEVQELSVKATGLS